jgi:hypothetical protein
MGEDDIETGETTENVATRDFEAAPWISESTGRAIADDRLELLLSEVHLVAGADALSATARAERIVDIAATIATALA